MALVSNSNYFLKNVDSSHFFGNFKHFLSEHSLIHSASFRMTLKYLVVGLNFFLFLAKVRKKTMSKLPLALSTGCFGNLLKLSGKVKEIKLIQPRYPVFVPQPSPCKDKYVTIRIYRLPVSSARWQHGSQLYFATFIL